MRPSSSIVRWITAGSAALALAVGVAGMPSGLTQAAGNVTYTVYNTPERGFGGSEILDLVLTSNNKYALVVGSNDDVISDADPRQDVKIRVLDVQTRQKVLQGGSQSFDLRSHYGDDLGFPSGASPIPSSIAVHPTDNYAIIVVRDESPTSSVPSRAFFINVNPSNGQLSPRTGANPVTIGVYGESVDIDPNGRFAVIANSDERPGAPGSISVIDLRVDSPTRYAVAATIVPVVPADPTARNIADPAPETVVVGENGRAFVTLQPNNAITIVDVTAPANPAQPITTDAITRALPYKEGTDHPLYPDGIAIMPGGTHIVTADEGIFPEPNNKPRAGTVSIFEVNSDRTLTRKAHSGSALDPQWKPEMVAVDTIGGQLKAFVTLEGHDAVAAFNISATSVGLDEVISLNRTGQPRADDPEGIAIAKTGGMEFVVTANVVSKNLSVIQATTTVTPTPTPTGETIYLPLITR